MIASRDSEPQSFADWSFAELAEINESLEREKREEKASADAPASEGDSLKIDQV